MDKATRKLIRLIPIDEITKRLPPHISIKQNSYKNTQKKCIFIDSLYGKWRAKPCNVLRGSNHPKRASISRRLGIEEIKKRLPKHIALKESTYITTRKKCTFVDEKYGEWETIPYHIFKGQGHPNACHKNSKGQLKMQSWVESLGYKVSTSAKPFNESKHEIDIYIPELKFGIEYNGKHWHTLPGAELKMLNKKLRAEQDGVKLLQFWCYEWDDEQERVKSDIVDAINTMKSK